MHFIYCLAFLAAISDARALSLSDSSYPIVTVVTTINGVPAPSPYWTPPHQNQDEEHKPSFLSGVPAPSCDDDPTAVESTGIPASYTTIIPSNIWTTTSRVTRSESLTRSQSGYTFPNIIPSSTSTITGVPAPDPLTSSSTAPTTCESTTGSDTTYTPIPANTSASGFTTSLASPSTFTSTYPTSTPTSPSCRPKWLTSGHTGTFRAAIIFIDFPDVESKTTIEELWEPIALYPAQLFKTMSYGKLDFQLAPKLDKFYRMPANASSYDYARGLTTLMHLRYINDALQAVGKDANFTGIDTLFVIPPKGASPISFSTSTTERIVAPDGSIIPSTITFGQDLFGSWGPKTVNHETGHAMGLPDLYPHDGTSIQKWVGGFDLMGVIGGQSPDYTAWHKWQLEWLEDSQIVCVLDRGVSQHRISPIEVKDETRDSAKAIAIPINGTQYVMAEVRSQLGINQGACGTGVLLYTADSAVKTGEGPIRVIDTKPNSSGCDAAHGGELNDAPLKIGEGYDVGHGVIVRVKSQEWNDYIVEVERRG